MAKLEYVNWLPLHSGEYVSYLRNGASIPIDNQRIDLSLLYGEERTTLRTPTNGDHSLVLRYKQHEGAVASIETAIDSGRMAILQLQGARSKESYRVATGLLWVKLFADQILKMCNHDQSPFGRIVMPNLSEIEGLSELGNEDAHRRYLKLADIIGMRYSKENRQYIKELRGPDFLTQTP